MHRRHHFASEYHHAMASPDFLFMKFSFHALIEKREPLMNVLVSPHDIEMEIASCILLS